ncbi:hypothetical protein Ahy_B05g079723 [Arachis hypogaea]|uniref:CCHC-type domain-containing protein n=1 Tax=Arachis hypogaea TaxID=3818 RepID=A0A444ZAQ4_ARAHY|nr:hypothetical protein Ahy_B05g079723 [Arachis hypogaea]
MIPNLPAELYNRYFLWKVGKSIGTMLKIDEHTSIHSREKFTRICVEVDLRKKLVPSFLALGKDFRLEYEGLHLICFNCGRYGHKYDGCPEKMKENHRKGENATAVQGQPTTVNTGNHFRKDLIATENPRVMEVVVGTLKESHKHQSGEKESVYMVPGWLSKSPRKKIRQESRRNYGNIKKETSNNRGASSKGFKSILNDLMFIYKANFCILLETQSRALRLRLLSKNWGLTRGVLVMLKVFQVASGVYGGQFHGT